MSCPLVGKPQRSAALGLEAIVARQAMTIPVITAPVLVPVVELMPSQFGSMEEPPLPWSEQRSFEYWRGCLAESGLGHLNPVVMWSWLVRLSDLAEPATMSMFLRIHIQNDEMEGGPGALLGGLALYNAEEPVFLPRCCGDFSDLGNWQRASEHRSENSAELWIGHPSLELSYQAPHLLVRETSATTQAEDVPGAWGACLVHPGALAAATARARDELRYFSSKVIAPQLALMGIDMPETFADALLGFARETNSIV
jgi:hypothetical protein